MKKGQFYIISVAVIIIMVSFMISSKFISPKAVAEDERTRSMFSNMKSELNYVVNIIIADSANSTNIEHKMHDFFDFLRIYSKMRSTDLKGYYFIGLPLDDDLNITIGNFLQEPLTFIEINVTNATATLSRNITSLLSENETTVSFESVYSGAENITVLIDFTRLSSPITFNATRKVFEVFELELGNEDELWVNIVENT